MQFAAWRDAGEVCVQDAPDLDDEIFAAGQFTGHEVDVEVQVLMVELVDHFLPDEGAQLLQVYHKAGLGVWFALHGDDEFEVVAVPIIVCAGAKDLCIPLWRPLGIVELVGGVEVFFAADVDHLSWDSAANIGGW